MCFSLGWFEQLLVWLVIILAIFALIKLLLPYLLSKFGADGSIIVQALNIVLWAFIAIVTIWVVFALIACLLSMGGGFPPLFPRGH